MLTNVCIYDCAYCINRRSNDIRRAAFTPDELTELTIEFYRRNYIEGLFLSSGVVRNPDYTMERDGPRGARPADGAPFQRLHPPEKYSRRQSRTGGRGGRYADRMSVNIEIPTERNLLLLAPDKNYESIYRPMSYIQQGVLQSAEERGRFRHAPRFALRAEHADDRRGHRRERPRHSAAFVVALRPSHDEARLLFGFYSGESLRQAAACAGQSPARARKPALSGRLADAVLRIPGRGDRRRADAPARSGDRPQTGVGAAASRIFFRSM